MAQLGCSRVRLRRYALAVAAACLALLTACTTTLAGQATPGELLGTGPSSSAVRPGAGVADDVQLEGTLGSATDELVINSMSDIIAYWDERSTDVFGVESIPPLEGGVWAIDTKDPDAPTPSGCGSTDPEYFTNNAFYCPKGDHIVYDIHYLEKIFEDYGDLDVAFVFAHEYGHALQWRFVDAQKSIVDETQADCFTGAWAASVTAGEATYWLADEQHLDGPIADYVIHLGDPAGHDPNAQGAHGSVFDRVTAIQEGYFDGPTSCVTNYNDDRVFAMALFDEVSASQDGQGNVDLDLAISQTWDVVEFALADVLDGAAPQLTIDDPSCQVEKTVQDCFAEQTVDITDLTTLEELHAQNGDFSVFTVLTMAYTSYVEQSIGEEPSFTRQVCVVAASAADIGAAGYLSPGDLDEAVSTVILLKSDSVLVDVANVSSWERLDAFRAGYFQGLDACGF